MTATKEMGDCRFRKDFPGGWAGDSTNSFTKAGRTPMQNEAWDYMQKLLQWRKTNIAIIQGTLIHYAPNRSGVYVYGRIKDKHTVMVMLNGALGVKILKRDRFTDITAGFTKGRDVITGQVVDITKDVTVPGKGELVLELE